LRVVNDEVETNLAGIVAAIEAARDR